MAKIKVKVNNKLFNLDLEDGFAAFLQEDLMKHLNKENNSIKDLIGAYINKNYEIYELHKRLSDLNHKLN
jgi:hypothetical protein